MSNRKRRTSRGTRAPQARLSRRAAVWLATVSTLVGVATGMFTLRDELFPRENGAALAVSGPAYQADVTQICRDLNAAQRRRRSDLRVLRRSLQNARSTLAQRDAILLATRLSISRSGQLLARLMALVPPTAFAADQSSTVEVWNRILGRIRAYGMRLDGVASRRDLLAAIAPLTAQRGALQADAVSLTAGLERLALPGQCNIQLSDDVPVPLPAIHTRTSTGSAGGKGSPEAQPPATAPRTQQTKPPAQGSGPSGRAKSGEPGAGNGLQSPDTSPEGLSPPRRGGGGPGVGGHPDTGTTVTGGGTG